ncbi:hypothetical protein [Moraxella catarrhalis]|uniref:Uncharacterized protein n=1 Tax=Moraxella catarrhalis TaxID=480 RepID=A0A198UI80_MORCA|nr:hypothetical protein [Moraxella catarrhalis]OAU94942.1 hypothetical protein AO384_1734 [Moraxella catarrhalis]OAU96587.1 hypothetical protein AO385_1821 [Moraxella catarrhalis]OAU98741.1 hypothetical protein AO383_0444 [Moraxella catarrhalis]
MTDKGLENHLAHAYEARLTNIAKGMDVRAADHQFITHAKAIYGIEDDPRFDQSIKDTKDRYKTLNSNLSIS